MRRTAEVRDAFVPVADEMFDEQRDAVAVRHGNVSGTGSLDEVVEEDDRNARRVGEAARRREQDAVDPVREERA